MLIGFMNFFYLTVKIFYPLGNLVSCELFLNDSIIEFYYLFRRQRWPIAESVNHISLSLKSKNIKYQHEE